MFKIKKRETVSTVYTRICKCHKTYFFKSKRKKLDVNMC